MSRIDRRPRSISSSVQRLLGRWALLCFRHSIWILGGFGAVGLLCAIGVWRLKLDPDITQLLPQSYESVRNVEALRDRFGGVGYVAVLVKGGTEEQRHAFADRVTPELQRLPTVRSANARVPVEFFEDRALYFLDRADLQVVAERMEARQRYQIERAMLDLDDEPPPSVDFSDLRQKYEAKLPHGSSESQTSGYYEDAESLMILVRPTQLASDLEFSRRVVADVEQVVDRIRAEHAANLQVQLAGRYKKRVDLQSVLARDLAWTSTLALILVFGYVVLHFRRIGAIGLVMVPLLTGMGLCYGFAGFAFGTLNVLTAFIGAILLGIGIDNGIHLLGRYDEARRDGSSAEASVQIAFADSGRVSLAAALTTSVAFACLTLSDFRAFREFGVLAAAGMFLVLFSYVSLLPALLGTAARHWPRFTRARSMPGLPGVNWGLRSAPRIVLSLGLLCAALIASAPALSFNADFAALDRADAESFRLDPTINRLLGRSQTPLVFLANDEAQARQTAEAVRSQMDALGSRATIGLVATLHDLVPQDQLEKQPLIERIRRVVSRIDRDTLTSEEQRRIDSLWRAAQAKPFTVQELPDSVRNQFAPRTGAQPSDFVLAYPIVSMGDATAVRTLSHQLREIKQTKGATLSAAGEPIVMADILDIVTRDAPRILLLTCSLILVALWVMAGSLRLAALSLFPALLTLATTAGLLAVLNIELNYFNMIMLPILLGIGVDDGMHMVIRVAEGDSVPTVWSQTGWNIFGAILTDLFGFGVLAFASHSGLASLGKVAIVGLCVNLVACVVLLPALLAWRPRLPMGPGSTFLPDPRGELAPRTHSYGK